MDTLMSRMHCDVVRMLYSFQRVALVPGLSACLLATALALTLRLWLLEPVARWRLATVAAVLCLLFFQCLYPSLELLNEFLLFENHLTLRPEDGDKVAHQFRNQRDHAFFTL